MRRNDFIRNTLLAFAATLLPEILRPMDSLVKEEMVDVVVANYVVGRANSDGGVTFIPQGTTTIQFPKKDIEFLENGSYGLKIKPQHNDTH